MPTFGPRSIVRARSSRVTAIQSTTSGTPTPMNAAGNPQLVFPKLLDVTLLDVSVTYATNNSSALGATTTLELRKNTVVVAGTGSGQTTPGLANSKQTGAMSALISGDPAGNVTFDIYWFNTAGTSRIDPSTGQENLVIKVREVFPMVS